MGFQYPNNSSKMRLSLMAMESVTLVMGHIVLILAKTWKKEETITINISKTSKIKLQRSNNLPPESKSLITPCQWKTRRK
jgi:hypothetical protein